MTLAISPSQILVASDPRDSALWDELVEQSPISDVYYRHGYAHALQVAGQGKAISLTLAVQDVPVLIPLLLRPLSDLPFAHGESGFDAVTPYGYGGLLPLCEMERLTQDTAHGLLDALQQWCRDTGVVSCMIRLHPLLDQDRWLGQDRRHQHAVALRYRTTTTAVNLTEWDSTGQRIAGLRKNRRVALNRARRWLHVSWSESDIAMAEALTLFRQVYEERMLQLNASHYYFFPSEYYVSLARGLGNDIAVALAWLDRKLVGASLFLAGRQFAHYHLSGSNERGQEFEASTLLINAGAQWARERGCKLLHLGGGVPHSNGLFDYKRSFGGLTYRYHTLEVIADESRYWDLVARRLKSDNLPRPRQDFFPQYRA